ncbi:MAG: Protein FdhD [Pseudomonadota bacterium]
MLQATSLKPRLTQARAELTRQISVVNEFGETSQVHIPAERALTVYLDKKELVTLMTLGASPEHLVLGFLLNQRLIQSVSEIESVTVDWSLGEGEMGQPGVAAIKTRDGLSQAGPKTAARVVTTGCGQGSVFGDLVSDIDAIHLPADAHITQATLYALVNAIRIQETTYKSSGSVHGCALFKGAEMLMFVEDVGRHNAVDTIAGWMVMNDVSGDDKVFYTTGRLTSEMVIKSAQMGVPIAVSRSGITQMGLEVAERVQLCAIGRATNKRFLCFSATHRLKWQAELAEVITSKAVTQDAI